MPDDFHYGNPGKAQSNNEAMLQFWLNRERELQEQIRHLKHHADDLRRQLTIKDVKVVKDNGVELQAVTIKTRITPDGTELTVFCEGRIESLRKQRKLMIEQRGVFLDKKDYEL